MPGNHLPLSCYFLIPSHGWNLGASAMRPTSTVESNISASGHLSASTTLVIKAKLTLDDVICQELFMEYTRRYELALHKGLLAVLGVTLKHGPNTSIREVDYVLKRAMPTNIDNRLTRAAYKEIKDLYIAYRKKHRYDHTASLPVKIEAKKPRFRFTQCEITAKNIHVSPMLKLPYECAARHREFLETSDWLVKDISFVREDVIHEGVEIWYAIISINKMITLPKPDTFPIVVILTEKFADARCRFIACAYAIFEDGSFQFFFIPGTNIQHVRRKLVERKMKHKLPRVNAWFEHTVSAGLVEWIKIVSSRCKDCGSGGVVPQVIIDTSRKSTMHRELIRKLRYKLTLQKIPYRLMNRPDFYIRPQEARKMWDMWRRMRVLLPEATQKLRLHRAASIPELRKIEKRVSVRLAALSRKVLQ